MEVLQTRPAPQVDRIAPLSNLSASFVHMVRERLSQIPPVPVTIKVAEEIPPEPLTNTTSLTTSTAGDASQSSNADTVATSILLVPSFFFTSKIHVAPTMQIEEDLLSMWEQRVRVTLKEILLHEITTGSCIQEFMMAGKDPFHLRPTVVVTCGNAKTQKLVRRVFRRQTWLQDLLKLKNMRFVAVIQPVLLSSASTNVTTITTIQGIYTSNGTYYTSTITSTMTYNPSSTQHGTNTESPTTTPVAQSAPPRSNLALTIGISVGLGIPAVLLILASFWWYERRQRKREDLTCAAWVSEVQQMYAATDDLPSNSTPSYAPGESHYLDRLPFLTESYFVGYNGESVRTPFDAQSTGHKDTDHLRSSLNCFTYVDLESSAPCGQRVFVHRANNTLQQHCTFGGIVNVAGEVYALSTGRTFTSTISLSDVADDNSRSTQNSRTEDRSSQQRNPFWFDPDDAIEPTDSETEDRVSTDDVVAANIQVHPVVPMHPHMMGERQPERIIAHLAYDGNQLRSTAMAEAGDRGADWALLRMSHLPRSILNKATVFGPGHSDSTVDITVTEFADTIMQGDVHVLYGPHPLLGHLCPSTSAIQVNGRAYDVKLVVLDKKLRKYPHFTPMSYCSTLTFRSLAPGCSGS